MESVAKQLNVQMMAFLTILFLLVQASKLRIARERGLKVGGLGQGLCTSMHSGQKGMMRNGGAPITRVFSHALD